MNNPCIINVAIPVYQYYDNGLQTAVGLSDLNKYLDKSGAKVERVDRLSETMLIYIISYNVYDR